MTTIRIGAIHALMGSIAPIEAAFSQLWPEAELVNLVDESLYADYARWGQETEEIVRRVSSLIEHSASSGSQAVLFSGSLFSDSVRAARTSMRIPVLTAYESMIEAAFERGAKLGLLATVADTITAIERDVAEHADSNGFSFKLKTKLVEGAMQALRNGNEHEHNSLIAAAASELDGCDALMLGQHSMARAQTMIAEVPGRSMLTSPATAALKLRSLVSHG